MATSKPGRNGLLPHDLPAAARAFLSERHLATFTTLRPDGSPHVVPVGFTWDDQRRLARVITRETSRKVAHASRPGARVALCQVDGWRWLTLEGTVRVSSDPEQVAYAVRRYAERYRTPRENSQRVLLEIVVDRVLGLVERAERLEPV